MLHTQDLRRLVDGPVKKGGNTRNVGAAFGVSAGAGRHAKRLQAQRQVWKHTSSCTIFAPECLRLG